MTEVRSLDSYPNGLIDELGKVTDTKLARKYGVSYGLCFKLRKRLGIPSYTSIYSVRKELSGYSQELINRLGKCSDRQLGREFGISRSVPRRLRNKLNILPYRENGPKCNCKKYYDKTQRDWHILGNVIRGMDNFTCQECGKYSINCTHHVHHIMPYRISNDNSLGNLITLCNSCHKKIESNWNEYMKKWYPRVNLIDCDARCGEECLNRNKECHHCSFNGALRISNYLVLKNEDGKTIRYLEQIE